MLFLAFLLTGSGLGASGGLNRLLVFVQDLVAPNHVDRTPYLLSMAGGSRNPLDSWIVFLTVGTVVGGFASGWLNGRLKIETNKGPNVSTRMRWMMAFIGGGLMGYGARLARGCTSGQALSGGAVRSSNRRLTTVTEASAALPSFRSRWALEFLMRVSLRTDRRGPLEMVKLTLDRMADGGLYDHLGGGFARYSVDERWLVPHFEKMLYDNALLANVYLDGYLATGETRHAGVVEETLDYILGLMTGAEGGFHSTEDADSEGEEGKFYVWTPDEVERILGTERAERFCYVYDVSAGGNFEGKNILHLPMPIAQRAAIKGRDVAAVEEEMASARRDLLAERNRRVRPGKDDKVIVSWNGLMIRAMARAGAILGAQRYVQAASRAAEFTLDQMATGDGRLLHTWRRGTAKLLAYLEDYACLALGLVSLYEATSTNRGSTVQCSCWTP